MLRERGDVEVSENCREREIDRGVGRRVTVLALVIELGDLDAGIWQFDLDKGKNILMSSTSLGNGVNEIDRKSFRRN